jgi:hypothetical protein
MHYHKIIKDVGECNLVLPWPLPSALILIKRKRKRKEKKTTCTFNNKHINIVEFDKSSPTFSAISSSSSSLK